MDRVRSAVLHTLLPPCHHLFRVKAFTDRSMKQASPCLDGWNPRTKWVSDNLEATARLRTDALMSVLAVGGMSLGLSQTSTSRKCLAALKATMHVTVAVFPQDVSVQRVFLQQVLLRAHLRRPRALHGAAKLMDILEVIPDIAEGRLDHACTATLDVWDLAHEGHLERSDFCDRAGTRSVRC